MSIIIDNFDFQNFDAMKYWSVKKEKLQAEMDNMIYSGNFWLSRKMDGNWFCIIKDMDGQLYTRSRNKGVSGEYPNKIGHIPHIAKAFENVPNGTVLLGEIYLPEHEKSKAVSAILGCLESKAVARQEKGEKLCFYIFDCLAHNGKNISNQPLEDRVEVADWIYTTSILRNSPYISIAKYIKDPNKMCDYIAQVLMNGGEGVVIQNKNNTYEFGKRTAHHSLKIKQEIGEDVDCFLTGKYKPATFEYTGKELSEWTYWYNQKTSEKSNVNHYDDFLAGQSWSPITKGAYYNWAGSVEFGVYDDEGKIVPIAWISNITEDVKDGIVNDNANWKGKVIKLTAMERDPKSGLYRHAKIAEWRNDKSAKDCLLREINDK